MKKNIFGFTLIEMLIVVALVSTLGVGILAFLRNSSNEKSISQMRMQAELAGEAQSIIYEIKALFNRSRDFLYTAGTESGQGALVLRADMRACDVFDPSTSSENFTSVGILCCGPQMTLTANKPGGGTLSLTSACDKDWGLSIFEFDGSGNLKRSTCKRNIAEMHVFKVGSDTFRNRASPQDIANIDFVGKTALQSDGTWNPRVKSLFFQLVASPGNIESAPLVTCSRVGLF
ncbi:MAG: type II secretion system protein [Proteobacteria bacterium]|nr:type II secretion system protein [Pseudomonadota bacterium]